MSPLCGKFWENTELMTEVELCNAVLCCDGMIDKKYTLPRIRMVSNFRISEKITVI